MDIQILGQCKKTVGKNIGKPWKGDVSLTHRGAKRSRGADRHSHILEASPGGREASKPALAKAREFLTIQPGFAADPKFSEWIDLWH